MWDSIKYFVILIIGIALLATGFFAIGWYAGRDSLHLEYQILDMFKQQKQQQNFIQDVDRKIQC
jgi:hypothetical protein